MSENLLNDNKVAFLAGAPRSLVLIPLVFFLTLLCPNLPVRGEGRLPVVASIVPLGDFCEQLGGTRVRVQVLIPPGASPHVFEPSPGTVRSALKAKVFVYVGAGLEPWAERLLKAHPSPDRLVVEAVHGVHLIQNGSDFPEKAVISGPPEEGLVHPHEPGHLKGNPHVWLDPVLVKELCQRVTEAFIKADPEHRPYYEARLSQYLKELDILHQEISQTVVGFRVREYVSFHSAFPYFARRYGLREAGVIALAPGREPSPKRLRDLIAAVKKSGVKAVFAEPQFSPRVAEVIAREVGVKVLLLDPLGGRPPYGTDYLKLMRHNLKVMAEAMQ